MHYRICCDMNHFMNTYDKRDPLLHEIIEQKYLDKNVLHFPVRDITLDEFIERNATTALLLALAFTGTDKNLEYMIERCI